MTRVTSAAPTRLSTRNWFILTAGVIVTAFLALGSHDLAIAHLGIPYPKDPQTPEWVRYFGQFVRLAAMVYACRLARWKLDKWPLWLASLLFGLLIVCLQETVRAIVVDNVISDGWIDLRWTGLLASRLPNALLAFYSGAIAVVISRKIGPKRYLALLFVVAAASAIGYFGLLPMLKSVAGLVPALLHLAEAPEAHKPPYGFYVYKYIYGMFIEPTIAAFCLIYLVWPALKGSKLRKIALFTALVLVMRGRVVALLLFSFWTEGGLATAFAAQGQFFVETLVLASLTGLTWAVIAPNGMDATADPRAARSLSAPL